MGKILFAVGGTGGHLFPAQVLAQQLASEGVEIFFAGAGLDTCPFFPVDKYPFKAIKSAAPKNLAAWKTIGKGFKESLQVIRDFEPDLLLGFGSYHAFPLLAAAAWKRVPFLLFESNIIPGKVNRLFSWRAKLSAVQFAPAAPLLKGKSVEVELPLDREGINSREARIYYGLDPDVFTLLVCGGSQGAEAINEKASEALSSFSHIQVIHLAGGKDRVLRLQSLYKKHNIPASVKAFEEKMAYAWSAADLAICRAGAATLGELLAFEVPAILVPYPHAADDHQRKNADFMQNVVKGARHLTAWQDFPEYVKPLLSNDCPPLLQMQRALKIYKQEHKKRQLVDVIREFL